MLHKPHYQIVHLNVQMVFVWKWENGYTIKKSTVILWGNENQFTVADFIDYGSLIVSVVKNLCAEGSSTYHNIYRQQLIKGTSWDKRCYVGTACLRNGWDLKKTKTGRLHG